MSDTLPCCVCGDPVSPPYNVIGRRVYCDRHYAALNRPNPGVWRAGLLQIVGMGVFSAVIYWLASRYNQITGTPLIIVGILLAVVPSALWLLYFYRQDRLEPEPKTQIALVFLVALLLTEALGRRVINDWFHVSDWAMSSSLVSLLGSVLIVGFTLQAITYVAVRAVYATPEFDERMDGIVYGTTAGLGVATMLNLHYILDNGGAALAAAVITASTTALAQASFAGLMGYFLAQAKFERKPLWWVPLGFSIAAVFNGLFSWLINEVSVTGMNVQLWRSLVLGLIVALAVFLLLVALMRQTTNVTLSRSSR